MTPRQWTEDEVRDQFLRKVWEMIQFWKTVATDQDRIEGTVFSILAGIDGVWSDLPGFALESAPHEDDFLYHESRGENWYPPYCDHVDIGGSLHELFHKVGQEMGYIR